MIQDKTNNARHLLGIVESTMDAIISVDIDQRIVLFNKAAEEMFLLKGDEAMNMHLNKLIPKEFHQSHIQYVNKFGGDGKTFRKMGHLAAVKAIRSNGEEFPAEAAISYSGEGSEKFYTVILRDVSERVNVESDIKNYIDELRVNQAALEKNSRELQRLNAELEELNINKNKLFSIIAHDLKSPFTALLGLSEFLKQNSAELSPDEVANFSSRLHGSLKNVLRLVENLLEWSRVQSDSIEFDPERFDIKALVEDLFSVFTVMAENKNIVLKTSVSSDLYIFADRNMIELVIRNLLSNAIKFTPAGGRVSISSEENEEDIFIIVEDTGIGIKEEHLKELFMIGRKFKRSGTANERGTGLGLILCKEFIERNNGKCFVESEENKGSIFKFSIPKSGEQ